MHNGDTIHLGSDCKTDMAFKTAPSKLGKWLLNRGGI